jgi:hypothetical protein
MDAEGLYDRLLAEVGNAQARLGEDVARLTPECRARLLAYALRRSTDANQRDEGWTLYGSFMHHAAFQLIFGVAAAAPELERTALSSDGPPPARVVALYEGVVERVQTIRDVVNAELGGDPHGHGRMELGLRIDDRRLVLAEDADARLRTLHQAMSMVVSGMPNP